MNGVQRIRSEFTRRAAVAFFLRHENDITLMAFRGPIKGRRREIHGILRKPAPEIASD
jgi:hypothetical protein